MLKRVVRHAVIGVALVAVAGIATANTFGYVGAPTGTAHVELLDGRPVLRGDLGEIVVSVKRLTHESALTRG